MRQSCTIPRPMRPLWYSWRPGFIGQSFSQCIQDGSILAPHGCSSTKLSSNPSVGSHESSCDMHCVAQTVPAFSQHTSPICILSEALVIFSWHLTHLIRVSNPYSLTSSILCLTLSRSPFHCYRHFHRRRRQLVLQHPSGDSIRALRHRWRATCTCKDARQARYRRR